jgi:hypothetical protein
VTSPERRSNRPDEINREYRYHTKKEGKKKPLSSITVLRREEEAGGSIWSARFLKSA